MGKSHKSRRELLVSIGVAGFTAATVGSGGAAGETTGRAIVGTRTQTAVETIEQMADSVHRRLDFGRIGQAISGQFSDETVQTLEQNFDYRYLEADGTMQALSDELDNSWGVDRLDTGLLHTNGETGTDADIAIIDTGIDPDHPDLKRESNGGNVGSGTAFVESEEGGQDSDGEPWADDHGHGTHCSGIAAALSNGTGVVGVSADATLHAVKVLDSTGGGFYSDVASGIEYVADQDWDVASLSLGGSDSQTVQDACQYAYEKGVFLVAAAGNRGPCTDCVGYPAAYSTVVAVSATTKTDALADFSSTGPEVELAAPGKDVYSTDDDGSYETLSGTSMACPHVSGASGQLLNDGFSNVATRQQLDKTAEDISLGDDETGHGLLDAATALCYGNADDESSSHTPPTVVTSWASDIDTTSATLNGRLTWAEGSDTDAYFQYRQSGADSWNPTSVQTLSTKGAFSESVSSLNSETEYEFRAVVETDANATVETADDWGWTLTFTSSA